jgi:hypothetical protein
MRGLLANYKGELDEFDIPFYRKKKKDFNTENEVIMMVYEI